MAGDQSGGIFAGCLHLRAGLKWHVCDQHITCEALCAQPRHVMKHEAVTQFSWWSCLIYDTCQAVTDHEASQPPPQPLTIPAFFHSTSDMAYLDFIKRYAGSIQSYLKRHTFAVNVTINAVLGLFCLASYIFLLALYLSQGMRIKSFTYVNEGTISPSSAISFCGAILTGATSALLSRCAEHNLWSIIMGSQPVANVSRRLTPEDSLQDAQWIVSPFARLAYIFRGHSWVLCLSGLFLFCTAVSNSVLLHGVNPLPVAVKSHETIAPTKPSFLGFTDRYDRYAPDCKYGRQN